MSSELVQAAFELGASGYVIKQHAKKDLSLAVIAVLEGSQFTSGELVTRFQPSVYAVALARLRNPAEAQELTQEVFIHGMTKLGQLRDAHCFAGWLRQITVRMAINRLTRGAPTARVDAEILDNTEAVSVTPLEIVNVWALLPESTSELSASLAVTAPPAASWTLVVGVAPLMVVT